MSATQQPNANVPRPPHVQRAEDETRGNQPDLRLQRPAEQQFLADAGGSRDDDRLARTDPGEQRPQQVAVHATDGAHGPDRRRMT